MREKCNNMTGDDTDRAIKGTVPLACPHAVASAASRPQGIFLFVPPPPPPPPPPALGGSGEPWRRLPAEEQQAGHDGVSDCSGRAAPGARRTVAAGAACVLRAPRAAARQPLCLPPRRFLSPCTNGQRLAAPRVRLLPSAPVSLVSRRRLPLWPPLPVHAVVLRCPSAVLPAACAPIHQMIQPRTRIFTQSRPSSHACIPFPPAAPLLFQPPPSVPSTAGAHACHLLSPRCNRPHCRGVIRLTQQAGGRVDGGSSCGGAHEHGGSIGSFASPPRSRASPPRSRRGNNTEKWEQYRKVGTEGRNPIASCSTPAAASAGATSTSRHKSLCLSNRTMKLARLTFTTSRCAARASRMSAGAEGEQGLLPTAGVPSGALLVPVPQPLAGGIISAFCHEAVLAPCCCRWRRAEEGERGGLPTPAGPGKDQQAAAGAAGRAGARGPRRLGCSQACSVAGASAAGGLPSPRAPVLPPTAVTSGYAVCFNACRLSPTAPTPIACWRRTTPLPTTCPLETSTRACSPALKVAPLPSTSASPAFS